MPYATEQQFIDAVSETEAVALTRAPGAPAALDLPRIAKALANGSSSIDSYLATRYPVPISPVPDLVVSWTIALAREELDRGGRDFVVKAADRVRAALKDIATGKATLGSAPEGSSEPLPASSGGPSVAAAPSTFDPRNFAGYLPGCGC